MIRFDPPHGGYPGEVVVHDLYLRCEACGWSYPLEALALGEPCDNCDGAIVVERAHPAPQSTLGLFR